MARLGNVCLIQAGGTPSRSNGSYWEGGTIPWVKISDFDGKRLSSVSEYITEQGLNNSSAKLFCPGTILYTIFATLGETCILDMEATTNQAIAGLQITDDRLITEYLYYFLVAQKDYVNEIGRGVAQNNINLGILRNMQIDIPSIEIQHQVTQSLDKVDALISLRKQQIAKLDELVKARFVEMFGDPVADGKQDTKVPLGSLAEVGSSKRVFEKEYVSDGVPFYRTKEIVELSKGNRITTELFISNERYAEIRSAYGVPQKGDLLISAVGTIGVIWIVDGERDFYFKDGNLLRVSASKAFEPVYLKCLLETLIGAHKSKMSSGTAYAALTISMLKEMPVIEVPLSLQHQFAAFVAQTDQQKLTIQHSLAQLELLKKALMQKYFG